MSYTTGGFHRCSGDKNQCRVKLGEWGDDDNQKFLRCDQCDANLCRECADHTKKEKKVSKEKPLLITYQEEEIRQALSDIKNWFKEKHPEYATKVLGDNCPSLAGDSEGVKNLLDCFFSDEQITDLAIPVVLEVCPSDFQLLDTYRLKLDHAQMTYQIDEK